MDVVNSIEFEKHELRIKEMSVDDKITITSVRGDKIDVTIKPTGIFDIHVEEDRSGMKINDPSTIPVTGSEIEVTAKYEGGGFWE